MFADGGIDHRWTFLLVLILIGLTFGTRTIAQSTELEPENELLLDLRLDGKALGTDILGYQRGEEFLISLNELSSALGFSISFDTDNATASGWYISEDRVFSLDLTQGQVVSGSNRWTLDAGDAVFFEGGLYVDAKVIEEWFPLKLSTVIRELYLDIESTELLPIQKRLNRREQVVSGVASQYVEPQHPLQDTPYQLLGPHITSLRLGYATTRQSLDSNAEYDANFASLSRGDLGWMTSTLSLAGRSEESLTAARLKLERTAFNGALGLNHFELGDVDAGGFRGLLLRGGGSDGTNGKRPDNETVDLEGSQLPDWDVELYQNNRLIEIQTTGPDGRYRFEAIPLQFGENRFELQFFGPNGEFESREEFHYLGPDMLASGQLSYQLSAVQKGHTVFDVNTSADSIDKGSGIYSGSMNFGITPNLTVGGNVSSEQNNGDRLYAGSIGFGFSTSILYGSVRYATATQGQNSVSTSLRTGYQNTKISLDFTRFFVEPELTDQESGNVVSPNNWQSSVDIASSIYDIPIKFVADVQKSAFNTSQELALATTVSLRGAGFLSSSIWHTSYEEQLQENSVSTSATGGQTSFNTAIRPWTFRLAAIYGFKPDTTLRQLSASSSLKIDSDMSLSLGVRQSSSTDIINYDGGINWLLDPFAISTRVSYNSNGRWTGLITVGTTLVHKPRTLWPALDSKASVNSGGVEIQVYEDVDDADRLPYEGASVNSVQTWRKAVTDTHGSAYLSAMPSHRQVDIELDESTLEDYELRSTNPGVSVLPRPGSYTIVDFPLVRTAELEGYVRSSENGEEIPVSRALVLLKSPDGEVVSQTRTAFDGFYLFEGVEPGEYQISLESDLEQRVMDRPAKIAVTSTSGVIGGLDYKLGPAQPEESAPAMLAQTEESQQNSADSSATLSLPILSSALPESEKEASVQTPATLQMSESVTTQENEPQSGNGNWYVQIGAYNSRPVAQSSWDRLSQGTQALVGKTARFMPYQSMTRLLVGPGDTQDAATTLCQQLKADNVECMVRRVE